MTKIIFFDIDGTLVKLGTTQISEKTKYALQKCKENWKQSLQVSNLG